MPRHSPMPFPLNSLARIIARYDGEPPVGTMVRIVNERRQDRARRDVEYDGERGRIVSCVVNVAHLGPPLCQCCGLSPCVEDRGGG